jgi:acyl carrier protein
MTKDSFLRKLEEIMELEPGTLKGDEVLAKLEAWDSLKVVEFLAFADEELSLTIAPKAIGACKTIDDLAGVLGQHVEV